MEDEQLLRQYCQNRSQEAFKILVERHIGMVFGAARRMVGDAHLAEEVAQGAFAMLAQKGASVRRPQIVGGWLYNTTRHLAMHALRSEKRRREREETAVAMQSLNAESSGDEIAEQLDLAMAELDEADRGALVLRFLEDRNLKEVGAELGITEDAARMRVNRAIERLREVFARRGKDLTSAALAGVLTAAVVKSVPVGLAAGILAGSSTVALTTITYMNWINAKSVAAVVVAAFLAGTGGYLAQKQKTDRLQAQMDASRAQWEQAKTDAAAAQQALAERAQALKKLDATSTELARTRNEIAQLRQPRGPASPAASAPATTGPKPAALRAFPPGTYVNRDRLTFAGYATPEATIQSLAWAAVTGRNDIALQVVPADLPGGQELATNLESSLQHAGPAFQGMAIAAEKILAADRMEVLLKVDVQPVPGGSTDLPPPIIVLPMVQVDNEWKIGGPPEDYSPDWGNTGQVKTFSP